MPITLLDVILIAVMLISAVLAMVRGFMREVLSIAAWVIAAVVALYFYKPLLPYAKNYVNNDIIATLGVAFGIFLVTLIVVSVITVRFSDMVLDSRVGALDRTLGFLFGLARGLIVVAVAFAFADWLISPAKEPPSIKDAKSLQFLRGTDNWLLSLLPDDLDKYISSMSDRFKKPAPYDEPADSAPNQRGALDPQGRAVTP